MHRQRSPRGVAWPAAYAALVYPVLILGLLGLVKARSPGRDVASPLDACIVTVSLGALS